MPIEDIAVFLSLSAPISSGMLILDVSVIKVFLVSCLCCELDLFSQLMSSLICICIGLYK
jgi:hypothetical protein